MYVLFQLERFFRATEMTVKFARFNIQLQESPDVELRADEWQSLLNDAAIDGYADEHEIFYLSQAGIVGVSIPFEDESPMSLLEAGSVLGCCQSRYEESDIGGAKHTWLSLHDSDDSAIDSPI